MYIIYCHHGNRDKGNPPTQQDGLTEIGTKDAKLVAEMLKPLKDNTVKAIYTSEFFRCTKTAEIINKYIKAPIIIDKRLNEHKSFEGETWVDTQTRTRQVIDEIVDKYQDEDYVICVTSGVNIAAFISKAYGLQPSADTPFLGLPNCCPIIFNYTKNTDK